MSEAERDYDPDWDTPLEFSLTPEAIMHSVFWTADTVHTGWESCVDQRLVISDMTAIDEDNGSYCRLAEQEYVEDESPEVTWHDWTVELKVGDTFVTAHWQVQTTESPAFWEWCASQAEQAFSTACVLVGKRVRRGLVVEENPNTPRVPRTHH